MTWAVQDIQKGQITSFAKTINFQYLYTWKLEADVSETNGMSSIWDGRTFLEFGYNFFYSLYLSLRVPMNQLRFILPWKFNWQKKCGSRLVV